jgi:hypothetical protein
MFQSRGARGRGLGPIALLLAAVLLPACSDNPTIPDIPRAAIVVEVDPNPITGVQNELTGSVTAAYVVRIRELAGLGATVNFVHSVVFDPETGLQVAGNYLDNANLKVFVGSDRVEGQGQLDVTSTISYTLPDFRIPADLTVNVQVIDDQGNLITQSTLVRVVAPV